MSNDDIENTELDQSAENTEATSAQAEPEQDLAAQLAAAQAKADENWNELLRAKADMENLRRRQTRDLENAHKHALDKFVAELMPICDSLELGLNASKTDQATLDTVREGMEMTLKMLLGNIGKLGLEQISPEGEAFNPELHQAVSMQPAEGVESNQVINVMQKGYSFNGRVIRPAMVVVSQ
jgi:molecular chaperone GrpE